MKLQRIFICIVGVIFAVGFAASQAGAGIDPTGECTDEDGNEMVIEVNALRAGAKTVAFGQNQSSNVTAKARILKGTAVSGTVIDTTLTIEAVDGTDVISSNSTGPIRLGVGKGGKGAKLTLAIPKCTSGFINYIATFSGVDAENDACSGSKELRKDCK
jgi:hypothetical protein